MESESKDRLQLVSFSLSTEEYGLDISAVQEIVRLTDITKVPRAPHFVEGVVNLRGKIVPVIDLCRRFGLTPEPYDKRTRIIIVTVAGRTVGFIVHAVNEVLRIAADAVDPTPELVSSDLDSTFIKGVGKLPDRLIILLDVDRILDRGEIAALGLGTAPLDPEAQRARAAV